MPRMIHKEMAQSESIASLTFRQRWFFDQMIAQADDQGRLKGHPALLRSSIFPYDDIPLSEIQADVSAIEAAGCIAAYEADGKACIQLVNWWLYQAPQWAYPSKVPPAPGWADKLRYRKNSQIIKDNWDGAGGRAKVEKPEAAPQSANGIDGDSYTNLPKDLGKSLPKDLGSPVVLDIDIGIDSKKEAAKAAPSSDWFDIKGKPTNKHPAISASREGLRRYPNKKIWGEIVDKVGSTPAKIALWGKITDNWFLLGWKPTNYLGMFDFLERGELPGTDKKGSTQNGRNKHDHGTGRDLQQQETFNPYTGQIIQPGMS